VSIESSNADNVLRIYFEIRGYGAIKQIEDFRKRLDNTIFTEPARRQLIEVRIRNLAWKEHSWAKPEILIWPKEKVKWI